MNFRFFFISTALGAVVVSFWPYPLLAQDQQEPETPAAEGSETPAEHNAAQYEADLLNCAPSSHVIPSLLGSLAGIEMINRSHIRGYDAENCIVEYTFATPEQPQTEATYLYCSYPPETIQQIAASDESGAAVDISNACTFNDNWANELGLGRE
jgi:hypothetical protein